MTEKVVVIGLDSPDVELLDRWMDAGVMPAFAKLAKAAAIFDLDSHVGYLPDCVWPEFSTGRSVGSTGQFDHPGQIRTGETRPRPITAEEIGPERYFWSVASRARRRVAVIDIPFGVETPGLNGIQVHGWYVHGQVHPRISTPDHLLRELEQRHGPHPAGQCDEYPTSLGALERLAGDLVEGLRRRKSLLVDLLSREDWDLFV
ncbi:MAG: hypothetical protein O7H39_09735, partial [Gammaproteobacteria bacterium]|nr:hypothetical protein [Gammaproteobacteria bacterium]